MENSGLSERVLLGLLCAVLYIENVSRKQQMMVRYKKNNLAVNYKHSGEYSSGGYKFVRTS